jgi:transposase InsO family protein
MEFSLRDPAAKARERATIRLTNEDLFFLFPSQEVYLHDYATIEEAVQALKKYFVFYNTERLHQSLDYQTPQEVYEGHEPTEGISTLCAA